ncbi:MAG: hypothetical protein AAFN68_06575, partial [Pseudomonadota bacterium]
DTDGNPSIIRYSRKTKEQYVMTEDDKGKATGWAAHFVDSAWVVTEKKKAEKKKTATKKPATKKAKN